MDSETHLYLHSTKGTQLQNGGALANLLVDSATGSLVDTDAQFAVTQSILWDEDIKLTLSAKAITDAVPVYYRSGADASNIWRVNEAATFGVVTTGSGRAAYNQNNAGTWQQTLFSNNNYGAVFVIATPTANDANSARYRFEFLWNSGCNFC